MARCTYLLRCLRIILWLLHVEVEVLKRRALSNLPMNSANLGVGRSRANIDDEVSYASEKVILVQVP